MNTNIERIKKHLQELARFGAAENGITRLSYSPPYEAACNFLEHIMQAAGLQTRRDKIGNLFGRIEGKQSNKTILIGSHADTVPEAGMFDGSLGIISGIEVLQTLLQEGYDNKHTLEVIAFIEEEGLVIGGTAGSKVFSGQHLEESCIENFQKYNINLEEINSSRCDKDTILHYLELHIEQGGILEDECKSIGIVTGIVGIARYLVTVNGQANHGGTTPMRLRDDALMNACKIAIEFNRLVQEAEEPMVGTIGWIKTEPGAMNVVPGKATFIIELRDIDHKKIEFVVNKLMKFTNSMNITYQKILDEHASMMDERIMHAMESSVRQRGYTYGFMPSGAGHDAIPMSRIVSTGMIFVPSKKGISHNKNEWTDWTDIEKGTNVLLDVVKMLDNQ